MSGQQFEIAVIGGGFAGSILARCLALSGRSVVLLERDRHPRFALGESSTPLANLALERLAIRFDQEDLYSLSAHSRWLKDLPQLRGGLKRGFTFYGHELNREYDEGERSERRLAVAASPDAAAADRQWLRADVDAFLLERARRCGVVVHESTSVTGIEPSSHGLDLISSGELDRCSAEFVVDASGGAAAGLMGLSRVDSPARFETWLLYGHFSGLRAFGEVAELRRAAVYPELWSAVHHLTRDGWMYQLAFDHGVTSVGFVVHRRALEALDLPARTPASGFEQLLSRYPTIARQFERARPVVPLSFAGPLPRRTCRATLERFALLPHSYAFFGPLFAPGLAWSLLGVERLTDLLANGLPEPDALERYADLLRVEADHLEGLFAAAWRELESADDRAFERFAASAQGYFAAASYTESQQRLLLPPEGGWAWSGFLGALDPVLGPGFEWLGERPGSRAEPWQTEVKERFSERNVAGLWDDSKGNLYPVDQDALVRSCGLLGLSDEQIERRKDHLLSPPTLSEARRRSLA